MASEPIRDQIADHLLMPNNSALLVENIVRVARIVVTYGLPVIL